MKSVERHHVVNLVDAKTVATDGSYTSSWDLTRSPPATVSDRAKRTRPTTRSMSDHFKATSSPRRAPVSAASAVAHAITGSITSAALTSVESWSGVGTTISLLTTEGGVARAVGAESIHPHLTAWRQAADKMECYLWTVAADSPSSSHWRYAASSVSAPSLLSRTLPSFGRIRASILRLFS